jgi:hypothetical protein
MNSFQKSIIAPQVIAAKLAAAENLSDPSLVELIRKEPRTVELLWFLQWASMQPGSLEKFAVDTIEQFPAMFGPAILHKESKKINAEQRGKIWAAMDCGAQYKLIHPDTWRDKESKTKTFDPFYTGADKKSASEERRLQDALSKITVQQFRDVYFKAAKEELAPLLRSMCAAPGEISPDTTRERMEAALHGVEYPRQVTSEFTWWCEDVSAVLFEAMDAHAARAALQLAQTEVVTAVFETLDYAWHGKVLVQIEGNSRFGKTESVRAWCAMHPGKVRLVSTPSSNYDKDIYKAVAESLGLQFALSATGTRIKEAVDYVIRHSGLMFIFDEAHFLIPQRIFRETQPSRLNWVRTHIIDRKLPVAIVTTPQAFSHAVTKFTRTTGYNFEQFLGRIAHAAALPDKISTESLKAIVKFYGPDLDAAQQKLVIGAALTKPSYIKAAENIISLARWIAGREGRKAIAFEDLELAAEGRMHPAPAVPAPLPAPSRQAERPIAVKRGRHTTPAIAALEAPARAITPATHHELV